LIDAKINILIVSEISPDDEIVLNNSEIEVRKMPGQDVEGIPHLKDGFINMLKEL
jgi:predicted Fe-Mo cluster-binding NifX family protein